MPVEYKLITCLPKAFSVCSAFLFSSRYLYSAYVLLIILSLPLSTLSCVHLCPNLTVSMTLFNSSRFLCCSIPSFGLSTCLRKTLTIFFIKCWNLHHMKNNITYRGNTNNTSVIIFFKIESQKLPAMVLCLGEPTRRFLLLLIFISFLYLDFIFDLHFVVVVLHLLMFFIHICFSTSSLTLPWTIPEFLQSFYTFSLDHRRVIRNTFIFNHSVIFLPRALQSWLGIFYSQTFFTLW